MSNSIKLSEIADIIAGVKPGLKTLRNNVKFIKNANLLDLITIDTENALGGYFTREKTAKFKKSKILKNDILISLQGKIGIVSIAIKNLDCFPGSSMAIIRPKKIKPEYLLCVLNSKKFQLQLKKFSSGTVLPVVSLKSLGDIEIPLMSDSEQLKVVKKFNDLKNNILNTELELNKYKKYLENFDIND